MFWLFWFIAGGFAVVIVNNLLLALSLPESGLRPAAGFGLDDRQADPRCRHGSGGNIVCGFCNRVCRFVINYSQFCADDACLRLLQRTRRYRRRVTKVLGIGYFSIYSWLFNLLH